jgi:hypothetical protein
VERDRTGQVWEYDQDICLVIGPAQEDPNDEEMRYRHPVVWLSVNHPEMVKNLSPGQETLAREGPFVDWDHDRDLRRIL